MRQTMTFAQWKLGLGMITLFFLFGLHSSLSAQGKLMGQIMSPEGTPVSGAAVYISGNASSQATISNAQGYYVFLAVPEGSYEVKASRRGLPPARQSVSVSSLQMLRLDIKLGTETLLASTSNSESASRPAKRDEPKREKAVTKSELKPASSATSPVLEVATVSQHPQTPSQEDALLAAALKEAEETAKTFAEAEFSLAESEVEVVGGVQSIYKKLVYPMAAEKAGIEGKVVVRVSVDRQGQVSQVKLISSASPLLNEEVFRVITEEANFKPATMGGKPVASVITIPITFKLR